MTTSAKHREDSVQESVWDYPRPPALEPCPERLQVVCAGYTVADTTRGYRVLETSHPPTYYFPPEDVRTDLLVEVPRVSYCEFKGRARYFRLDVPGAPRGALAWCYPEPSGKFRPIQDYFSFYASVADGCWVGDEQARAQAGDFYGGWITSRIVGPFKGGPGTAGW
jgi:uncharacterized protein (DUF427 family)